MSAPWHQNIGYVMKTSKYKVIITSSNKKLHF